MRFNIHGPECRLNDRYDSPHPLTPDSVFFVLLFAYIVAVEHGTRKRNIYIMCVFFDAVDGCAVVRL